VNVFYAGLMPVDAVPSGALMPSGATLSVPSLHGVNSMDLACLLMIVLLAAVTAGLVHACERLGRGSARK
jgi:hypothetical protein